MDESRGSEPPHGYGESYYSRAYNPEGPRWTEINWWSARFYASLCSRILRRSAGCRFLEIGCGLGFVLRRLEPSFETWGVDISEYAVSRARENSPGSRVLEADVSRELPADLAPGSFDLILARYVLEHLAAPGEVISRCSSLLRPGGAMIYAVPNTLSPGVRLKGEDWFGFQDETHLSLLSPDQWFSLTSDSGLEISSRFSDGLWDIPYIPRVPRVLQYGLFAMPTVLSVLTTLPMIPFGWGENLIVVAKRPE